MWVALFSALLGALVGGLASSGGSLYVARANSRRAARGKIVSEILPRTADVIAVETSADPQPVYDAVGLLYRNAVVAGAADVKQMKPVMAAMGRLQDAEASIGSWRTADAAQRTEWNAARLKHRQEIFDALRVYSDWLDEQMQRRFG